MRFRPTALVVGLALIALPAAESLGAFAGARLLNTRSGIGLTFNGTAYPRVLCAGGTDGFCAGTITITRRGQVLGRAPFAVRSNDSPGVQVNLRGGSRTSILRGGRSVRIRFVSHDNADPPATKTVTQTSFLKAG